MGEVRGEGVCAFGDGDGEGVAFGERVVLGGDGSEGAEVGLGVVVEGESSARGMVDITRSEARGRSFRSRGAGGGRVVVGVVVGGRGCGMEGGSRDWAAASSQAARAEGSTGQEEGGGAAGVDCGAIVVLGLDIWDGRSLSCSSEV